MQLHALSAALLAILAAYANAAPSVELELATERGVQITAPQEWLQLLTTIGIENVRIRSVRSGDKPRVDSRGTARQPRYLVVGILTARHELELPGRTFSRGDRAALKDYFDRLTADGAEALTAPRGRFGLTEKEMTTVLANLSQPIEFETKGQLAHIVIGRLQAKLTLDLTPAPGADRLLRSAEPVADELKGLTAGTGLAILLRSTGLVMRPEKSRGEPVVLRIMQADAEAIGESTLGKPDDDDMQHWPIGWEPQQTPGELAPSLFEFRNAEIEGYTLEETLVAIGLRVKVPIYLDHATLAAHQIEPAKIKVRLARTRTIYKRVIDRVLAQARLGSQVRVDEAGSAFLWITQ
jgi:hypothetical protein